MSGWDVKWRDGYVEGFSTAQDSVGVLEAIQWILHNERPIEIKVTRR